VDASKWRQLQSLFDAAVRLPPEERATFLSRECGDDAELRRELERLLAHDGSVESIERAVGDVARDAAAPSDLRGRRLGSYEIDEEIGHGGMGTVLLAHRADAEYEKRVAIKLIRGTFQRQESLLRFRNERQILAALDHPGIARLLDGGTSDRGEPYVVMEYVEGRPIDRYCDENALGLREKLRLFQRVCAAVHFAHGKLVVHRDIKPGNILVTASGEPKLLDFGIAKLLDPGSAGALVETETAQRVMTPYYASPEQIRGEPVATSSDVYSLGVLLYELLTGRRPYELRSDGREELEQAILHRTPASPSAKRGKTLARDLDNIVLMALRKEPARRYTSAEQLSADIERYLGGLPVIARPATVGYRLSRFVRRNRAALAAVSLVLLALTTLVVFYTVRLKRERDQANLERNKARQVADLLVDLFEVSDPSEALGNTITAREILDRAVETLPRDLQHQPEIRASMLDTMGRVYRNLGLYEKSRSLLEQALETRRDLAGHDDLDIAETLYQLGRLDLVELDYASADERLVEAAAIRERLLGPEHPDYARALYARGEVHAQSSELQDERALLERALAIQERTLEPTDTQIADTLTILGVVHMREVSDEAGLATWQRAAAIKEAALGPDHPDLIEPLNNVCYALRALHRHEEALPLARRILALCVRHLGPEHLVTAYNQIGLSNVLFEMNQVAEAARLRVAAVPVIERALGPDHQRVGLAARYAGEALSAEGEFAEARRWLERALPTYPAGSAIPASIRLSLARVAMLEDDADELIRQARAGAEKLLALEHPRDDQRRAAFTAQALAAAYEADRPATLERIDRAMEAGEWSADSGDGANLLLIATALALVGEEPRSVVEAERGLASCAADLGAGHAVAAQLSHHYLEVLERRGATEQAEAFHRALP
jgi:serine/threonine-protein kinase